MCTQYVPSSLEQAAAMRLGVANLPYKEWPDVVFPGYDAPIVAARFPVEAVPSVVISGAAANTTTDTVLTMARFGLVPRWSRDAAQSKSIAKGTYNARHETAAIKPSFRNPWRERQWALIPMAQYFDPCWEDAEHNGGRSIRWRIAMNDDTPFTCAGLWERWRNPATGSTDTSFSLLTVNADGHPLCGRLHRPGDEKRMPVIVAESDRHAWLNATSADALRFMKAMPATQLTGGPAAPLVRPTVRRRDAVDAVSKEPNQNRQAQLF